MKVTALTTIIYFFSVLIQIQSTEIIYVYNYDDFSEIFQQGSLQNFNVLKYEDIDTIFDKPYEGSNIGGAFLMNGGWETKHWHQQEFNGYIVDVTATFYCGKYGGETWQSELALWIIYSETEQDEKYICSDNGWSYNYTWIPPTRFNHGESFSLGISGWGATADKPYGFDEIRIRTTTKKPSQLLTAMNPAAPPTITAQNNSSNNYP